MFSLRRWIALSLVLPLLACSDPESPSPPPLKPVSMDRSWSLEIVQGPDNITQVLGGTKVQLTGVLSDREELGPSIVVPHGLEPLGKVEVFSNGDGTTYWADAQSPHGTIANGFATGAGAFLNQHFKYVVDSTGNAGLKVTVTAVNLQAIDFNPSDPSPAECRRSASSAPEEDCAPLLAAMAFNLLAARPESLPFLDLESTVTLSGYLGHWSKGFDVEVGQAAFDSSDFVFNPDADGTGDGETASLLLKHPITYTIPLDGFAQGDTAVLISDVITWAEDDRQGESSSSAYFRDPITPIGVSVVPHGVHLVSVGSEPLVLPTAVCTGSPGSGGSLQFKTSNFVTAEEGVFNGRVVLTRTGGTTGPVSVLLTTGGGSATPDGDYVPASTVVRWADGQSGERVARIPLRGDTIIEPDETVGLSLSQPGGCATLGSSTATLTIRDDDDQPVQQSFSISGTVSGLTGSGLLLQEIKIGREVRPTGDGPFTIVTNRQDGSPYEVRVIAQPSNPLQVCSVANGIGNISGANVTNVAVTCTAPPGSGQLDPAFGTAGRVATLQFGPATTMALQSDGKVIVAGKSAVERFNADGTLDTGFGSGGKADFVFDTLTNGLAAVTNEPQNIVVQADGKIVVTGFITSPAVATDCVTVRFNPNGTLDQSFAAGGKLELDFASATVKCFGSAPDGTDLYVAGQAIYQQAAGFDGDFAVMRIKSSGAIDSTFGLNGLDTINVAGVLDAANAVKVAGDGKVVLAGRAVVDPRGEPDLALVRLRHNGVRDSTFNGGGTPGVVLLDLPEHAAFQEAADLVIQPDGRIVVGGTTDIVGVAQFLIARFTAAGTLDPSFGTAGLSIPDMTPQGDVANGVAMDATGGFVLAGVANADMGVARYDSNGQLVTSFGDQGKLLLDFFSGFDGANAAAIMSDGRIVVAGFAQNGQGKGLGIARLVP